MGAPVQVLLHDWHTPMKVLGGADDKDCALVAAIPMAVTSLERHPRPTAWATHHRRRGWDHPFQGHGVPTCVIVRKGCDQDWVVIRVKVPLDDEAGGVHPHDVIVLANALQQSAAAEDIAMRLKWPKHCPRLVAVVCPSRLLRLDPQWGAAMWAPPRRADGGAGQAWRRSDCRAQYVHVVVAPVQSCCLRSFQRRPRERAQGYQQWMSHWPVAPCSPGLVGAAEHL